MKKSNAILTLVILPLVLFSDAALGQQGTAAEAVSLARKGEYASAATALERLVTAGTVTPAVV